MNEAPASFEGWAIVEMMGHRREIGYVTTEHYGAASLFRVDSPEFPEREYELTRPEWIRTDTGISREAPIGSKVKRLGIPAKSCLVGPGSLYALNPCTEATARKAIEQNISRPLILLAVPENAQLIAAEDLEDQVCPECGSSVQYCECGDNDNGN